MTGSEIEKIIIEYFKEKEIHVDRDTDVFRSGIVDSMSLIELIIHIEKSVNAEIPATALAAERVETVGKLAQSISDSMQI